MYTVGGIKETSKVFFVDVVKIQNYVILGYQNRPYQC
jgi:hypothetical protein